MQIEKRLAILAIGVLLVAGCTRRVPEVDEPLAVRQAVSDYYTAFSGEDQQKYRALVTQDYLILENGELLDIEGDVAAMPSPEIHSRRKDVFDFRTVKIQGNVAYAVYFLSSDITDDNGARSRRWLESAILRRSGKAWRMALLHSTRIDKPIGS